MTDDRTLPITPYRGTGGWAGTDTSRARAEHEVDSGKLSRRQAEVLASLVDEPSGLTWAEIGARLGLHHGQVSGALSNLHKAGLVFQTLEPRSGSLPYVHGRYRMIHHPRRDRPSERASGVSPAKLRAALDAAEAALDAIADSMPMADAFPEVEWARRLIAEIHEASKNRDREVGE